MLVRSGTQDEVAPTERADTTHHGGSGGRGERAAPTDALPGPRHLQLLRSGHSADHQDSPGDSQRQQVLRQEVRLACYHQGW